MKFSRPVDGGPCWVELSTPDVAGAEAFYSALFGWRTETDPRPEAGGYTVAHLGDAPVAALTPPYQPGQPPAWTVSFLTRDTDATVAAAARAGGSLLAGPLDVFDQGRFAVLADPCGAVFSLWQARAFGGARLLNEPGALGWVELTTRDRAGALDFYPAVFGWTVTPSGHYPQWGIDGQDFGGLMAMDDKYPPEVPSHWLPYFAVRDADRAAADASAAGGRTLMPPTPVGDRRRIAVLRDPQGATFGVHGPGDGA
ncbi:VOC family protein [Streptomyces sp. SDr-06]|uniref:VOC family protein n=1 Tax=Streptomyces sp. SDr-06 TaxID=2267702 RepID=UPI000DEB6056|nr:VOC family protein [Streptomyces sp. SDr-06]RCH69021.1 VOC family protein [Streptomyces sp. SDr-06]